MQKKIWFLVLSLMTISCTEKIYVSGPVVTITKTDTIVVNPTSGQVLQLLVDWSKFTQSFAFAVHNSDQFNMGAVNIDQVGSRLVYVNDSAVFTQVVSKTNTSQPQLITLQVPPTDKADLYIVATGRECSNCVRRLAIKLGVKRGIKIRRDTLINLTLDSLTLVDARWYIDSTTKNYFTSNDTIFATRPVQRDTIYNSLDIRVSDPYQIGVNVPYIPTMFVGFFGSGRLGDNLSGMRLFRIDLINTITKFSPKINGYMFGLNYEAMIGKEGIVVTNFVNP